MFTYKPNYYSMFSKEGNLAVEKVIKQSTTEPTSPYDFDGYNNAFKEVAIKHSEVFDTMVRDYVFLHFQLKNLKVGQTYTTQLGNCIGIKEEKGIRKVIKNEN